jgi:hypothetical protein
VSDLPSRRGSGSNIGYFYDIKSGGVKNEQQSVNVIVHCPVIRDTGDSNESGIQTWHEPLYVYTLDWNKDRDIWCQRVVRHKDGTVTLGDKITTSDPRGEFEVLAPPPAGGSLDDDVSYSLRCKLPPGDDEIGFGKDSRIMSYMVVE